MDLAPFAWPLLLARFRERPDRAGTREEQLQANPVALVIVDAQPVEAVCNFRHEQGAPPWNLHRPPDNRTENQVLEDMPDHVGRDPIAGEPGAPGLPIDDVMC